MTSGHRGHNLRFRLSFEASTSETLAPQRDKEDPALSNKLTIQISQSIASISLLLALLKMSKPNKKKTRQYAVEFLKFGFIPDEHDERKPFCLLCNQTMSNESMKAGRLEAHLKVRHPNNSNLDLEYFKSLKEKFKNRTKLTSLFHAKQAPHTRALEASYEISLLIAKHGKNHTIGEQLIKPAISIFLKTVLQKDDGDIRTMPLSNNTVSNRIDEMGQDVESQLIEKLKLRKFSYKWTNPQSGTVRLCY
ncbi:zinc finger BED domain-containing protein 5-like [Octopus sinensis]|uniref:Zinc finger BED domain-containing protein 5-like n=1 Tax=Octopus sinensis TaxID=2607531 RepID=A0A6P7SN86_9MOLL|nr:zinc finger BED domain-containing protein 5-like [Octopus sinensis]